MNRINHLIRKSLLVIGLFVFTFVALMQKSYKKSRLKKKSLIDIRPPKGWRIEVEILFAALDQKDCNVKPQQMLNKVS